MKLKESEMSIFVNGAAPPLKYPCKLPRGCPGQPPPPSNSHRRPQICFEYVCVCVWGGGGG